VTRRSILEYAQAIRIRYLKEGRKGKAKILDEFVQATGLHRKSAVRLLNRVEGSGIGKRRGRPRRYGTDLVAALKIAWEACDCLCSRRLQPFLPELVGVLKAKGELSLTEEIESQLCRLSASTIDRITRRWRRGHGRRGLSTTKPGTLLKNAIPIRTFSEWEDTRPGFIQADLVAHCGDSGEGFYLTTLSTVDVATGWCEPVAVWGKGQERVGGAVHHVRQLLPMPMLGLDSDNGSEFINRGMYDYCRKNRITFTRSRCYKKNDSCHVEQKNGNVERRLVGYERYASKAAFECLGRVYDLVRLYINFFQPTMKLVSKTRRGAKVHKVYDTARTPYQRLVQAGVLTAAKQSELSATYHVLNPVKLLKQINDNLEQLWRMAKVPPR